MSRATAPLRPEHRLALACACDCDPSIAAAAAAEIPDADWPAAVGLLDHHFLAPVVLSRLTGSGGDTLPAPRRGPLSEAVARRRKRALLLQATMGTLHDDHLGPLGVRYAMLKGLALGARYYAHPGLRVARDIDVLVDRADLEPVLRSLFAAGYRLLDRLQVANSRRPAVDDALAMARLSKELALMSPHGACVEIHHRVDPTGTAFPTAGLLARTETIEIWNRAWPVLSTTDLFAYICAHHAGHRWSRLHWVLDLSMMRRHPSFDADAVLGRATAAGVRRVVEAAMDLPEALAAMVREAPPSDRPRGLNAAFVAGCIAHLDPQDAPERAARRARGGALLAQAAGDIRYQMRLRDGWPARLGTLAAMTGPRIADYQALPLPPRLHPLYRIIRPVRLAARTVARRLGRPGR